MVHYFVCIIAAGRAYPCEFDTLREADDAYAKISSFKGSGIDRIELRYNATHRLPGSVRIKSKI